MATRGAIHVWNVLLILFIIVRPSRFEDNISVRKSVATSSNQDAAKWPASAAVDGDIRQEITYCASTLAVNQLTAWWRVDLGQLMTINYITIYYRAKFEARFAGYQIFVSNTTDMNNWQLCYEDASSTIEEVSTVKSHQCQYVAQYVTIYNYRNTPTRHGFYWQWAVLELCEVQVLGCPIRMYGEGNCNQPCPEDCYGGNCNAINASCFYCVNGKYGDMCDQDCSDNCKDQSCMKDDGSCLECITGKYGNDCTTDCSDDCRGKTCMMTNGHCIECVPGKHGDDCTTDCSDNCRDKTCVRSNGHCIECVPGKHGDDCTTDCSDNCRDTTCVRSNGHCIECVKGKHGDVCDHDCSDICKDKTCLKENGFCFDCIPGKTGELCTANCSSNCVTCNQTSEQCFECTPGKFGPFCTFDCLGKCKDNICQQIDGLCTGCEDGYFTDHCNRSCPSSCTTDVCDMITGYCTEGTYDEIGSHTKTQPTETNRTDTNYEQLNALEREPSHVYETV